MTPADPLAVRLTDLIAKLPKHRMWKLAERFVSWREKSDGDEQFVSVADLERHVSSLAADLAGPRTCETCRWFNGYVVRRTERAAVNCQNPAMATAAQRSSSDVPLGYGCNLHEPSAHGEGATDA